MRSLLAFTLAPALLLAGPSLAASPLSGRVDALEVRADETDAEQSTQDGRLDAIEATDMVQDADIMSLDADVVDHEARISTLEATPSVLQFRLVDSLGVEVAPVLDFNGNRAVPSTAPRMLFRSGESLGALLLLEGTHRFATWSAGATSIWFESNDCTGQSHAEEVRILKDAFPFPTHMVTTASPNGNQSLWVVDESSPPVSLLLRSHLRGSLAAPDCRAQETTKIVLPATHVEDLIFTPPFSVE